MNRRSNFFAPRLHRQRAQKAVEVAPDRGRKRADQPSGADPDSAEDGFLRARWRVPVRRGLIPATRAGRIAAAAAVVLALGGLVLLAIGIRNFFRDDPRFRIASSSSIQIMGNSQVTRSELLSVFGSDLGRNIFFIPLRQRREALEQLPWVEHATVMRLLPDQLRVAIVERTPVAFVRQGNTIGLVDAHGVLLHLPPAAMAAKHYSFPVVTGISASDPLPARASRMHLYQQFISDLDSGGTKVSTQLSEVDITDPEDIWALLPAEGSDIQVHFGDSDFLPAIAVTSSICPSGGNSILIWLPSICAMKTRWCSIWRSKPAHHPGTIQRPARTRTMPEPCRRSETPGGEAGRKIAQSGKSKGLMSPKSEDLLTVLDAGSSKIRVLVAELHEGALRYRAHSVVNAEGMRKGLISDLHPRQPGLQPCRHRSRADGEAVIANCVVGLGGPHVRGINSQGGISLGNRLREITREDVRAAVDRARSVSLPADREILHLLPQQFILDEQPGIHDPIGMIGNRLEVNLHIATCSASAAQSVVTCANKAGLEVTDTVFEGIAAAEATVSADERELGACLIDIGAGSTELVVFFEGAVAHTAVVPIGGEHFTNDLAVGLHISVQEAEALKLEYGHCVVTSVPSSSELELIAGGSQVIRTIQQRQLSEILEPRARELFHLLRENLRQGGVLGALGAGCVLTGGGARLAGLLEVAESLLRVPARLGYPVPLSRMPDELIQPEFSTAIGMLLYTHRTSVLRAAEDQGLRAKLRAIFAGSL